MEKNLLKQRFQLRQAAGLYWLLDMEQAGVPYHTPVPFNETGAIIWKAYAEGSDEEQIAERLGKMFAMEKEEMLPDVREFLKGIHKWMEWR